MDSVAELLRQFAFLGTVLAGFYGGTMQTDCQQGSFVL